MNKIAMTCVVFGAALVLSASSFAQTAGPVGGAPQAGFAQKGHAGGGMMRMNLEILAKLDLSPDQKAKIKVLDKTMRGEMKELRTSTEAAGATVDKTALKAKRQAIQKEYREALMGILTDAQKEQYKTLWKEAVEKAKAARKGAATTPAP